MIYVIRFLKGSVSAIYTKFQEVLKVKIVYNI